MFGALFLSIEFQQTGYLSSALQICLRRRYRKFNLRRMHTLPIPIIRLNEFLPDTQKIGLGVIVGQAGWNRHSRTTGCFTSEFVQRSRFTSAYPTSLTPTQFVDRSSATRALAISKRPKPPSTSLALP